VSEQERVEQLRPESVRAVRLGHGANCSSIGSVIDTLFASAVIGGAVLAAILAAMKTEPITIVSPPARNLSDPGGKSRNGDEATP
jgi:hypothetical protein